ncbi:MAG: hypothetical protein RLZZ68_1547 [Bacteroidota bacterium]
MYDNFLFLGHGYTIQASEAFVQQRVSATVWICAYTQNVTTNTAKTERNARTQNNSTLRRTI